MFCSAFIHCRLDPKDLYGHKINPAVRAGRFIADWLYQWGPPQGGTIFSGFDGLATVVIAAMSLQNFNVIAFEKDERIWKAAIEEVTSFGRSMDNKMERFMKLIENSADLQHLVGKAMANPKSLTVEQVSFTKRYICCTDRGIKESWL